MKRSVSIVLMHATSLKKNMKSVQGIADGDKIAQIVCKLNWQCTYRPCLICIINKVAPLHQSSKVNIESLVRIKL